MARIVLENVSFSYPVFDVSARSLKSTMFSQMTGGAVATDSRVVEVQALQDISFSLADGDRLGLIGRNGSGKSTMLRLLAGLAYPKRGRLKIEGRAVPLISQGLGINPELSGMANIELPLRLLGATDQEVSRAKREIPEFTGLGNFINLPIRTYSDGMKARFTFALSTSMDADILILDEWLSAGDADFQARAQARMKALVDRARILVITSHSMDLIRDVCTQVLWLDRSEQMMIGAPAPVIDAYLQATTPQLIAAE